VECTWGGRGGTGSQGDGEGDKKQRGELVTFVSVAKTLEGGVGTLTSRSG